MPCVSDYMEPTGKERKLQQTAKLLEYALFELDLHERPRLSYKP